MHKRKPVIYTLLLLSNWKEKKVISFLQGNLLHKRNQYS